MATSQPLSFAETLRRYRIAAGLTQEQLAERAGLSVRGISDLERGVNRGPRKATAERLADALSLTAAERAQMLAACNAARARPEPAYKPTVAAPSSTGATRLALVGREREMAAIERHLAGEGPPVLVLAGEPGIGKTRLLQEAQARAREMGWTILTGSCHRQGGQEPYAPITAALQGYLSEAPPAQARMDLHGCPWLVRLLPELAERGLIPLPTWSLPAEQERRLVFDTVARFLKNISGPMGALLALDDLQWAEQDALDLLASLVRNPDGQHVRMIAAYRETEVRPEHPLSALLADLATTGRGAHLRLKPLATVAARQLLDNLLQDTESVDSAVARRLLQRTGGMPFFLVSCAQEVRAGLLDGDGQDIPWDVAQSIRQRVAAVPDLAGELMGVAALAGRHMPARLLLRVGAQLGHAQRDLLQAIAALCDARLLEEDGAARYRIPHDLIREAVIADLGMARRMALHESLATALDSAEEPARPEVLAYHYAEAGDPRRAVVYLERAGDYARAVLANAEAEGYYRQLVDRLDALGQPVEAARARLALGGLLLNLDRFEQAEAVLDAAIETFERVGDLDRLAHAAAYLAGAYSAMGAPPACLERLLRLYERVRDGASPKELAMLCRGLGSLYYSYSDMAKWLEWTDRLEAITRAIGDDDILADALDYRAGYLLRQGYFDEALRVNDEALALAERTGNILTYTYALHSGSLISQAIGDLRQDREWVNRAQASAARMGRTTALAHTFSRSGKHWLYAGDWVRARADFERQRELAEQVGEGWQTSYAYLDLGQLDLCIGRDAEGLELLRRAIAYAERAHDTQALRQAHPALAEYEVLQGQPAAARDRLLPLLDAPGERAILVTRFLPLLAWAWLDLDDDERYAATLAECVNRATASQMRPTLVEALRVQALGDIRAGAWEKGASALEQALALSHKIRYPYLEAKALTTTGQLYVASGALEHARESLTLALAILSPLGERPYADLARRLLADCQG